MQDIRLERWAKALIEYSLYIKPGETVAIMATSEALPLVEAVYREVLHAGAHPVPMLNVESLDEILLREGNDAQLTWASPLQDAIAEKIDARLSILSSSNTKALSNVDPDVRPYSDRRVEEHGNKYTKRAGRKVSLESDALSYGWVRPG